MNSGKEEMLTEEMDSGKIEVKSEEESGVEQASEEEEKPLEKMKKSDLVKKIQSLEETSQKNYELFLRSQADFENLKKRTKKEKEDWVKYSNETLIKQILPVMDNLEKAISHSHEENSLPALREGVELTFKGLKDALEKSGILEVKALGEPFDPNFHEAVLEKEDESVDAGTVLQELQKGYTLHQRLIRPSMVIVSRGGPKKTNDSGHTS